MSIRYLALDLYQAMKKVENLEAQVEKAGPQEKGALEAKLYVARREYEHVRKLMDGKKEP